MKTFFKKEVVVLHKTKGIKKEYIETTQYGITTQYNIYKPIGFFGKEETIILSDTGVYEVDEKGNPFHLTEEQDSKLKTLSDMIKEKVDEIKTNLEDHIKDMLKEKVKEQGQKVVDNVKNTVSEKVEELKNPKNLKMYLK